MNKLLIAAAFSGILLAGPAAAQGYIGGGVGASNTDNTETSWKLYGGYQFNPTWGVEVAYTDLGRYKNGDIESWSLAGTGTMPLDAKWSLFGKLGAASNRPSFNGGSRHSDC